MKSTSVSPNHRCGSYNDRGHGARGAVIGARNAVDAAGPTRCPLPPSPTISSPWSWTKTPRSSCPDRYGGLGRPSGGSIGFSAGASKSPLVTLRSSIDTAKPLAGQHRRIASLRVTSTSSRTSSTPPHESRTRFVVFLSTSITTRPDSPSITAREPTQAAVRASPRSSGSPTRAPSRVETTPSGTIAKAPVPGDRITSATATGSWRPVARSTVYPVELPMARAWKMAPSSEIERA